MESRRAYTAAEKLSIVVYAEENGNRSASRKFHINESNVRLWRKTKEKLAKMPALKAADRGASAAFPVLEELLLMWLQGRRQQGRPVSVTELRLKAISTAKVMANVKDMGNMREFKASYGWAVKFMRRNYLSVRRRAITETLPSTDPVPEEKQLSGGRSRVCLYCSHFVLRPYGCGTCDEMFEIEKEFMEHCYRHYSNDPEKLYFP